jgi:hypothetical protein
VAYIWHAGTKARQFLYSIKKEGDSRIFQAQDRAIDGKPRNGSIDKF